jgi:signal transduction histidine kinase
VTQSPPYPINDAIEERKQTEETLRQENQHLKNLLALQDRDRQLICCELHDGLVQQLVGAIMQLETGHHDVGLDMLRKCMKEARCLIEGLRPPILDEGGVVVAIENLVSQEDDNGKPTVEFSHKIVLGRLPPSLEYTIFRIVQEGLTNARRHSQSMKVRIQLVQQEDGIRIEVEDWGVGFNSDKIADGHFGLEGIKERARLFGGAAMIRSSPGRGTRIVVQLPLPASLLCPVVSPQSVLD